MIAIPNMSKPKNCAECFYGLRCKAVPRWVTADKSIPKNCPLIEIDQEDEEAVLFLARMRKAMREGKSLREFLDGDRRSE